MSLLLQTGCRIKNANLSRGPGADGDTLTCRITIAENNEGVVQANEAFSVAVSATGGVSPYEIIDSNITFDQSVKIELTFDNDTEVSGPREKVILLRDRAGETASCSVHVVVVPVSATTPTPTPTPPVDNRIPEWGNRTGKITLPAATNYSNLEIIFDIIYPPVVGDPKIAMDIDSSRMTTGSIKKLYLGVEDDQAFTYREWTALDAMSSRSSSYLDGWFLDDQMVVHVSGSISAAPAKVTGKVEFRVRQSGESQCVPSTVTYCSTWHTPAYYAPGYCGVETNDQCFQRTGCQRDTTDPNYVWCCDSYSTYESLDTAACQSYMGANPSVKTLGTFEAEYSRWLR